MLNENGKEISGITANGVLSPENH